jgi:hypothetical protein
MGASLTIYCLEKVTDYFQFERLCHDLMVREGYQSIEPLGGFSDKGRDAVHISNSNQVTIFAYSVREDWRVKLAEDTAKIHKHKHTCDQLVFITTADFTSSERDEAVNSIFREYGWKLNLYGVERLRILLDSSHPDIKKQHPQIFPPEFLIVSGETNIAKLKDHLFISCVPEDGALADWLTRKLSAEGYAVWCERFKLLGGESYPDDIDEAIKNRTFRMLGLYSKASLRNPEVMRQRSLALNLGKEFNNDFLIPVDVDGVRIKQLDRLTSNLAFISFETNWATGLNQLLKKLSSIGCPKPLYNGKSVAAEYYVPKDIVSDEPEELVSNCLVIEKIPASIHQFEATKELSYPRAREVAYEWAFRKASPTTYLSFHQPPLSLAEEMGLTESTSGLWAELDKIHGIGSRNLVAELIRKSLIVKCHQLGLKNCPDTNMNYFPLGLVDGDRLKYHRVDGSRTFVNSVGQRTRWRVQGSIEYRYHLAPTFYVVTDLTNAFDVQVQIRVRIANTSGGTFSKKTAHSLRKHLCKDWWNNDWLGRLLAVCQYLASDNKIIVGESLDERLVIQASPMKLTAAKGIDEQYWEQLANERKVLEEPDDYELEDDYQGEEA